MLRLYLHAPATVLSVYSSSGVLGDITYPVAEIDYDMTLSGDYDDVMPGMTVIFGSSLGRDDLGRGRVRKFPTADTIYFGRSSQGTRDGEINILPWGVYTAVLDEHRVWAKIPTMPVVDGVDLTTYKDADIPVGIHTTNPPPVANCGPGFAGTIDPLTGVVTVNLDARNSIAIADGATITGYYWYLPDGTITFGDETWDLIEAQFPAGFRYVYLTVTDSNGQEHTACCPVYARDPANDTSISAFEITRHTITPQGQQVTLRILQDIPAATYPDGTLVMLWDDDVTPNADRQGMRFIGWHHTDPAQIAAERLYLRRDVELHCLDVAGKLDTLPGFPQVLYSDDLRDSETHPTITWEYMVAPTIRKYLHYLLQWHSTALDVADFRFRGVSEDYPFLVLESGGASLFDQVNSRAQALTPDHLLTCNRRGQLAVWPDPMLLDPIDRTEFYQGEITQAMWSDMRYSHQRPPRVYWLRAGAILSQATPTYREDGELDIPTVFCVAPGEAPGMGETQAEENERLALSQEALNRVTGHRYARLNAPDSRYTIQLTGGDDLGLEPADLEWVRVHLPPSVAAQRGHYFEKTLGVLLFYFEQGLAHQIDIRYQHEREGLLKTVTLEWEREVVGTPAVTVIPPIAPPADDYDPHPYTPPEPEPELPGEQNNGLRSGVEKVALFAYPGHILRTNDFQTPFASGGPTWVKVDLGFGTGADDTPNSWVVDPFSPGYRGVPGGAINSFFVTNTGIYKLTDMFGATPSVTELHTWAAEPSGYVTRTINCSFGRYFEAEEDNPWIMVVSHHQGTTSAPTGTYATYSKDGGATWQTGTVSTYTMSVGQAYLITSTLWLSPRTPGLAITEALSSEILEEQAKTYYTTDWGATWAELTDPDIEHFEFANGHIHVPWEDNADENRVYYSTQKDNGVGAGSSRRLKVAQGTVITDISPNDGTRLYGTFGTGAFLGPFTIRAHDNNRQYMTVVGAGSTTSTTPPASKVFVSSDAGATWTEVPAVSTARQAAFGADTPDVLFMWGVNGSIYYSSDFGVGRDSRLGNMVAANGGSAPQHILGIAGGPLT